MSPEHQRKSGLRERKKAKTMTAVQSQALRLFQEQGYKATTVEQIVEAAEVSYSTFFRYFNSKEDVLMTDNYDPLLIAAFEEQPVHLGPIEALRKAMIAEISTWSADELNTMRQRNTLIMSIPELRASLMNNMAQMMHLVAELVATRVHLDPEDIAVRSLAGAVIGVNISVMEYYADHPDEDFGLLLEKALIQLEKGFQI
ncbi:TetR family transcriptional regulator [Paenibacillus sp. NPDC057886]|uniref:acyl-CoA-like ligand-binding transcription factor n=1 Tax=Paenibacillus sp. NPDC057886 TaxID=3346270 RepID=UPI003682461B